MASDYPEIVRNRRHRLEEILGGSLPFTYGHQPDVRNQITVARHLNIRRRLGIPIGVTAYDC